MYFVNRYKMLKLKYFVLVSLLVLGKFAYSQQVPILSQYLFNGFLINPAYAGLDGLQTVSLTSREQWVGIPGSPKTQLVSYQTRLLKNSFVKKSASARRKAMNKYTSGRVGVGAVIFNDRRGVINRTGAQFTYAYHMKAGVASTLSMAVTGSFHQFYLDRGPLQKIGKDALLDNTSLNLFIPDMGFGMVYSSKKYYAGLSVDQLLQSYLKLGSNIDKEYELKRQYYLTGGYKYDIDRESAVEPSMLFKMTSDYKMQTDFTCRYIFFKDYWAGLTFRTGWAFVVMGGLSYQRYHFGYSFDYGFNQLYKNGNWGSHEFMFSYKFGDNASRLRWLNR
jgi:type IX secretion system PorP/SprF family membrane protein